MNRSKKFMGHPLRLFTALAAACALLLAGAAAQAQTTAAKLSPDLQEILKFSQAHMTDDVILSYIKNSGKTYSVSADDMLFLNSQGVSQPVISALLQAKSGAPPPAAPAPAAPTAPVPATPAPMPVAAPAPAPIPGLADFFNAEGGLNPGLLDDARKCAGRPCAVPTVLHPSCRRWCSGRGACKCPASMAPGNLPGCNL